MREGARLGAYRVLRKLGEGGMGAVYVAEHTLLGRRAAIKVLLPELSAQRHSVDRFFNEARATSAVSDPGVVQVFDFGYEGDTAYIVMELLDGEQLNTRLKRIGALDPAMALRITRQTARSLATIHAAGLVHRDLKPDNLFIIRDPEAPGGERPKILDFGIAKLGADDAGRIVTRTGQVMGTPIYMAPEQCGGEAVDHRADVYSLGCVFYQMLTGRPPFRGGIMEVISAHLKEAPPVPSAAVASLPGAVDDIVRRCLAKRRDERFATMLALHDACDAAMPLVVAMPVPVVSSDGAVAATLAADAITPPPAHASPPQEKTSTINASVGEQFPAPRRSRRVLWGGLALAGIGLGVTLAIALPGSVGPTPNRALPTQAVVAPAVEPPLAQPDAAVAPPVIAPPDAAVEQPAVVAPTPTPKPHKQQKPTKPAAPASRDTSLYDDR